ncbi:DEAD/DEAH box helicase family protein [Bacillus sp. CGMCC 1.16541]|uniref:DEAD/DEAH box helicase family protein n=1 Tax=Bacillus sp. CGMCC 1.16541 TaxID=2185143 RepID=UPI000D72EA08|nr:DEAD/DEAH box helicase family protein [Bacillus sp. CGMCC 1.16541]
MSKVELVTSQIGKRIKQEIEKATSIYILTSFVMDSGVKWLSHELSKALERGAEVKVLAGDYLFVTQPHALKRLIELHPNIEVRLWKSNGKSFHPKAYMFGSSESEGVLMVGSSNLSASALSHGVEWSLQVTDAMQDGPINEAYDEFIRLFQNDQTITVNVETISIYEKEYELYHQKHPYAIKEWTVSEEETLMLPDQGKEEELVIQESSVSYHTVIEPRFAQVEALQSLNETYREEGYNRAMVVMATGLGKTYLAAFFAKQFKRVLFIAHREEILHQAKNSFQIVMPDKTGGIYNGKSKESDVDFVFASVYTLSMECHLYHFNEDEFDLIVVDEFHHAAANTYQKIINYFKPSFLLGITATPDRMDNKDVYGLCDGNVAYSMHFIEAVQKGWLAPFRYYGVYDDIDYSAITWLGTKYDQEELLAAQLREEHASLIRQAWEKHKQTRTIGFCSSILQANFLSQQFNQHGYQTVSLHSKTVDMSRLEAIKKLERGELDVIFTVDLFNEGTDIPAVDTLLMVRPTESLTVFTQQVGRGLRIYSNKTHCTIIDLIGNYRNADHKLSLFHLEEVNEKTKGLVLPTVPANCEFHLETKAIDLLKHLSKKHQPRKEQLKEAYLNLKREIGRRPTYQELHLYGKEPAIAYKQEFKSYVGFLAWANELSELEEEVFQLYESWLVEVEKTGMTKSYKMIVLKGMLERGKEKWLTPITPQEVAPFFHTYLTEKNYRKKIDFSDKSLQKLWEYDEEKISKLIAKMPMTKWSGSSNGIVTFENSEFKFDFNVESTTHNDILYDWTTQICEYRLASYFEKKAQKPGS